MYIIKKEKDAFRQKSFVTVLQLVAWDPPPTLCCNRHYSLFHDTAPELVHSCPIREWRGPYWWMVETWTSLVKKTEVRPFLNASTHSYTLLSPMHASPYCCSILPRISRDLTPSDHNNLMTDLCSSVLQTTNGAVMLKMAPLQLSVPCHLIDSVSSFTYNVSSMHRSLICLGCFFCHILSVWCYFWNQSHITCRSVFVSSVAIVQA